MQYVAAPLLCGGLPLVCITGAEWMGVSRHGPEAFLWVPLAFVLAAMLAAPLLLAGILGLAFRRVRRRSLLLVLCSAAFLAGFIVSLGMGETVRMNAFHRLARRSEPLISAVRAFEQKYGRPPPSLQALVPEFLPGVPSTGIGAYPKYEYSLAPEQYAGNPWVITVFTPSGGINFDQFMYFPLTNYPKRGYGGCLQRVGDWAYVHE